MTLYTNGFEIPYPQSTDLVKDGATAMQNLATQVDTQMGYLVNRNYIINGNMQVWQRSTSVAAITASGYYTADRWNLNLSSLGTWTQSRSTDVPTAKGFGYSLLMDNTTADAAPAAGDFCFLQQKIEGQNLQNILKGTSLARPVTVSFWVKTTTTGTMIVELEDITNSRQVSAAVATTANTWVYATATFPADTTGTIANSNAVGLALNFWIGAGTTYTGGASLQTTWGNTANRRAFGQTNWGASTANNVWITGVQLEVGDADTPFEHEPIAATLAKCQRYTWSCPAGAFGTPYANTATAHGVKFPVTMRAAPPNPANPTTMTVTQVGGAAQTATSVGWQVLNEEQAIFNPTGLPAVFTIGAPCYWSGSRFLFDAEL